MAPSGSAPHSAHGTSQAISATCRCERHALAHVRTSLTDDIRLKSFSNALRPRTCAMKSESSLNWGWLLTNTFDRTVMFGFTGAARDTQTLTSRTLSQLRVLPELD